MPFEPATVHRHRQQLVVSLRVTHPQGGLACPRYSVATSAHVIEELRLGPDGVMRDVMGEPLRKAPRAIGQTPDADLGRYARHPIRPELASKAAHSNNRYAIAIALVISCPMAQLGQDD